MATKNGHKSSQIQGFVKDQLEEAQRRFNTFESDAEKMLKHLIARGKEQRRELEGIVRKLNSNGLNGFSKKANQAGTEVRKRLDVIQAKVVETVGVASQAQVREINRELNRLSKKLDALLGKRGSRTEASA